MPAPLRGRASAPPRAVRPTARAPPADRRARPRDKPRTPRGEAPCRASSSELTPFGAGPARTPAESGRKPEQAEPERGGILGASSRQVARAPARVALEELIRRNAARAGATAGLAARVGR